jgi:hypothetical protein
MPGRFNLASGARGQLGHHPDRATAMALEDDVVAILRRHAIWNR